MRTLTVAVLAGLTLSGAADAADLDYGVLRGPEYETEVSTVDWSGIYFGAHTGYTSASNGFKNVFQDPIAKALLNTTAEANFNASTLLSPRSERVGGGGWGAFVGYNYQFQDTVVGVEFDYTRFGKTANTADSISRFKVGADGYLETVSLSGLASTKIEDYGTFRVRGGYAIGNVLPFVTGGLAIGRAQVADEVRIRNYGYDQATYDANQKLTAGSPSYVNRFGYASFDQTNPGAAVPNAPSIIRRNVTKVVGGVTLGGGLEYALTQNILLRGEYQYVLFNDFDGHKVNLNTVRAGAAVKF